VIPPGGDGPPPGIDAGSNIVYPPPAYEHASITSQDFLILKEGTGSSRDASIRDISCGICFTSLASAIALWGACSMTRAAPGGTVFEPKPCFAFMAFIVLAVVSLLAIALTWHRAKGDSGRPSYQAVVTRIQSVFHLPAQDVKPPQVKQVVKS
jgi:hypothetical protein